MNPAGGSLISFSAAEQSKQYYDEMLARGDNLYEEWLENMKLPFAGWLSTRDPETMDNFNLELERRASVLESGCPNFAPIFSLNGALALFNRIGINKVTEYILQLTKYLH